MPFTFDTEGLKTSIKAIIAEYLDGLAERTKQTVEVDAQSMLNRATELGLRAANGDQLAAETLRDLQAQALMLLGMKADDEQVRALNTARMIIFVVIRTVIAAAITGL